jgi:hypothetical protein
MDNGYPLLQEIYSYTDVTIQATLDQHAESDLAALSEPVTIPKIAVAMEATPLFGTYITGDDAIFRVQGDERFPEGTSPVFRIVDMECDYDSRIVSLELAYALSLAAARQEDVTP